jgi:carbon monoxide dehydrogenase subunit G
MDGNKQSMFACREEGEAFLSSAPVRIVNEITINASCEEVFAVLEDAEAWPRWFAGIENVEWTSGQPFGVGTTRTVTLTNTVVEEYFFIWDHGRRYSFYFTATSTRFVNALCEDYQLVDQDEGVTKFIYTVAYEPCGPMRWLGLLTKPLMKGMFSKATQGLKVYIEANRFVAE